MHKDYYKILNINRNATQAEIKKSFRSLSKQHHPDKGGDEGTFKEISEAYDTLSSTEKKHKYDNPNPFDGMRGGSGGGGGAGPHMDDLFNQFFGGRHPHQQPQVKKGRTLKIPLVVKLDDVYFGNSKKLKYERNINCHGCSGYGGTHSPCHECRGSGQVKQVVGNAFFRQVRQHICGSCNGKGYRIHQSCRLCNGVGNNMINNTVEFKVPKDLMTGQIFTYKGIGDDIVNGITGDLSLEVVIEKHLHFKILGVDLLYEPKVSILDLILGKELIIPYFGTHLTTAIPENSGINSKFSLNGKGLNGGALVIQPEIHMPHKITAQERETLKSISEGDNFRTNL